MDKVVWKLTEEWPYFVGNILVGVRVVFLTNCLLVFPLLKYRVVRALWTKKMKIPNRESLLNSNID